MLRKIIIAAILIGGIIYYKSSNPAPKKTISGPESTLSWNQYQADDFNIRFRVPAEWIAADMGSSSSEGYINRVYPLIPEGFTPYDTPITIKLAKCDTKKICDELLAETITTVKNVLFADSIEETGVNIKNYSGLEVMGKLEKLDPNSVGKPYREIFIQRENVLFRMDQFDNQFNEIYESVLSTLEFY